MNAGTLFVAAAGLFLAGNLGAASISLAHEYGEFVDRGVVRADVQAEFTGLNDLLDCSQTPTSVVRVGNKILLTTRMWPNGHVAANGECMSRNQRFAIGALEAGTYQLSVRIEDPDGGDLDSATMLLQVLPIDGRCNRDPLQSPSVWADTPNPYMDFLTLTHRLKEDPVFAASIGNPALRITGPELDGYSQLLFTFPPLYDIPLAMERLKAALPSYGFYRMRKSIWPDPPTYAPATIVEYYNAALDHYFYTGDDGEMAAIDSGKVGPGWTRTSKSFEATSKCNWCDGTQDETPVYRFQGIPGVGPSSHFFTRDRSECHAVDKSAQWSFEGVPFFASAPRVDGSCKALGFRATMPLFRAWRPYGDSNHRFSTDPTVIDEMVSKGWVNEGVAMCVWAPG
jgi:hypothetical protein